VPSKLPALLALASSLAVLAAAAPARAEASAWMYVGGGTMVWKQGDSATLAAAGATKDTSKFGVNGMMTIDVGAGTTPTRSFIFGSIFRVQPVFANGVDLAMLARLCTHGFQVGDWGLALDAGAYLRTWGPLKGGGFAGGLSLGAPLGFTLAVQTQVGNEKGLGVGATLGIDLLRLTVYRKTLENWWQNPGPNPGAQRSAASGAALQF
jgi:hypothetical protein